MARHKQFPRLLSYFVIFLVLFGVIGVAIGVNLREPEEKGEGVARIDIDLNDITLEEMKGGDKETKYAGNQLKVDEQGVETSYENVEIKGRGNLTWGVEKKPWRIKFDKKTDFLGITKAKQWVFLANYFDRSYIRADLALKVAEMLGEEYNTRGKFAEVYFDGEYEGLFYVLPKIGVGKGVVNLKDEYGVVVEMDNMKRDATDIRYSSYNNSALLLKDAVSDDEATKQVAMRDFLTDFNLLEKYARGGEYKNVAEVADMESFAEYYLVNEFTANPDAYTTSFYFYKDGPEDKIHAGPVWDFDLAFGNEYWGKLSATETMERRADVFGENGRAEDTLTSKLMYYLMDMPEFQEVVKKVYREEMAERKNELLSEGKRVAELIRDAAVRDGEKWKWGEFDVWVEEVLDWAETRYDYFEEVYGNAQKMKKNVI